MEFFRQEYPLKSAMKGKQSFRFHLDEHLPASFHQLDTLPNLSYSINLIDQNSKTHLIDSIPIHLCPRLQIDQPLLLVPLFFGPIVHHEYRTKLEVKLNRTAYTFHDFIQLFYELKNPRNEYIDDIDITLGIFYRVESNVHQEDIADGVHGNGTTQSTTAKLIRNKVFMDIPHEHYFPPTWHTRYHRQNDGKSLDLDVDYKIQIKIYITKERKLWQVDIPIVIGHDFIVTNDTSKTQHFQWTR